MTNEIGSLKTEAKRATELYRAFCAPKERSIEEIGEDLRTEVNHLLDYKKWGHAGYVLLKLLRLTEELGYDIEASYVSARCQLAEDVALIHNRGLREWLETTARHLSREVFDAGAGNTVTTLELAGGKNVGIITVMDPDLLNSLTELIREYTEGRND